MVAGKQYEVYVHKGKPIWKIITGILFSHAGLFCVCMGYGLLGIFLSRFSHCGKSTIKHDRSCSKFSVKSTLQ